MNSDRPANVEEPIHGGDTGAAEARFGRPAQGWLDLSTGIAPFSYPVDGIPASAWRRLPESKEMAGLVAAARTVYGAAPSAAIVAAPGSQALIQRLPGLFEPGKRVAVIGPTYGEHARAWAGAGHAVAEIAHPEEGADADVLVIVNPNNPGGQRYEPARIAVWASAFARRGGLVVVDEAFADVTPENSMASLADAPGVIVLRSFGKFFGLAGLRLGFGIGTGALIARVGAALGPWPVAGPAIAIAARAFADRDWIAAQRARLADAAHRLRALLTDAGFEIVGGTDLFLLSAHDDATEVFARLARAGILVRRFPTRPRWLRFGMPGAEAEWARLGSSLDARAQSHRAAAARG